MMETLTAGRLLQDQTSVAEFILPPVWHIWHSHSKLSFHLNGKLRCSPELALYCTFDLLSMVYEVIIHLSHITCNISPSPLVIVEAKLVTDITII